MKTTTRARVPTTAMAFLAMAMVGRPADLAGQVDWTVEQREILAAMEWLSASTAPDGQGADAYGAVLASDFSRWSMGSETMSGKSRWVEAVREWFDQGWRVVDRVTEHLEITVVEDVAHTRRVVTETYRGPDGTETRSGAALAEVWVRRDGPWLLFRVNAITLDVEDARRD